MELELIKKFNHLFLDCTFSGNMMAFSTESRIYVYRTDKESDFSLLDSFSLRNAYGLKFAKNEEVLYILDTYGEFYEYTVKQKELKKIANDFEHTECFGDMYVLENSDCLWCGGDRLFRYFSEDSKIEQLFQSEHTLNDIIYVSDNEVCITIEEPDNFYILKAKSDGAVSEHRMPVSRPHKVLQHWFSKEHKKLFLIKGNKLQSLDFSVDFEKISEKFETVCTHRVLKDVLSWMFDVSPKGDLIAFSDFNKLIVFDILSGKPVVKIKKEKGTDSYFGQVAFLFDSILAVSVDNGDFGGKTYIYKILD